MPERPIRSLTALREAECTRCPLYRDATQVVPGEGPTRAQLMLIGEQPGNDEDLAEKPFVGPAGRELILAAGGKHCYVRGGRGHFQQIDRPGRDPR